MKLRDLVGKIDFSLVQGDLNIEISDIFYDSRKCIKNSVLSALKVTTLTDITLLLRRLLKARVLW